MKNLIIITLLFIAQLSFGQTRLFSVYELSDYHLSRFLEFSDSDSTGFRIDSLGEISIKNKGSLVLIFDSTQTMYNTIKKCIAPITKDRYELERKLKFYEDRFGKINGSLDNECVELLPAEIEIKHCPIVVYKKKNSPPVNIKNKSGKKLIIKEQD